MKKQTFSCGLTMEEMQAQAAERAAWGQMVITLFEDLADGHDLLIEPSNDDDTGTTGSTVLFLTKQEHGQFVETERHFSGCTFETLKALVAAYVTIANKPRRRYFVGGTPHNLSVFDVRNLRTREEAIAFNLSRVA